MKWNSKGAELNEADGYTNTVHFDERATWKCIWV